MQALAGEENGGIDEMGAALELIAAIESLAMEPRLKRYQELTQKDGELNDDERAELKDLNTAIHLAKRRAG
jgi:hypothetical protein